MGFRGGVSLMSVRWADGWKEVTERRESGGMLYYGSAAFEAGYSQGIYR